MKEKAGEYMKLVSIFIAILGIMLTSFFWANKTFATKDELLYLKYNINSMQTDIREIRQDIKEVLRIVN